jgi:hypothetical protein
MAPKLPAALRWQPSDVDARAELAATPNIAPAIQLDVTAPVWPIARADAVFAANLVHIAPWAVAEGLFAGAGQLLGKGAPLILYGPFKRDGLHTAPSNAAFDAGLMAQDTAWGVRCLDTELAPLAERAGFGLATIHEMPANNLVVVWHKAGARARPLRRHWAGRAARPAASVPRGR